MSLTLPDDVEAILALPSGAEQLEQATDAQVRKAAEAFGQMLRDYVLRPGSSEGANALRSTLGEERHTDLADILGQYFFKAAFRLLSTVETNSAMEVLELVATKNEYPVIQPDASEHTKDILTTIVGGIGLVAVVAGRTALADTRSSIVLRLLDAATFSLVRAVASLELTPGSQRLRLVIIDGFARQMHYLIAERKPGETKAGPFSRIDLEEFQALAHRQPVMTEKYGTNNVEKVFEQQLALLVQSLGFYVVQTRLARRQVDLVCINQDPSEQYTILVEAKTTRKPYTLPAADQRALSEYADDVRRILVTLPPLRLILLVGPAAGGTVEAKLNVLEGRIGIPIRFVSAGDLASLRDHLPGPAPAGPFRESALRADHRVLTRDFVIAVAKAFDTSQKAHIAFVESLLAVNR